MKVARVVLLLLLAMLLPVRGAMAATMLCPPASAGAPAQLQVAERASQASAHEHAKHAHHDAGLDHGDSSLSAQDKCNLCSAFCSMTPLPSSATPSVPDLRAAAVVFPRLRAPAPSFVSDGQERPPRSI